MTFEATGRRIVNHTIEFVPSGQRWYVEDFFDEEWWDDEYVMTDPGGMTGTLNLVGRATFTNHIVPLTGRATFRALGTYIQSQDTYDGQADFDATGTFVADGKRVVNGTADFSGTGIMDIQYVSGRAHFSGEATMEAIHHVHREARADFITSGIMVADGDRVNQSRADFTGDVILDVDGTYLRNAGYKRFVFMELRRRRVA